MLVGGTWGLMRYSLRSWLHRTQDSARIGMDYKQVSFLPKLCPTAVTGLCVDNDTLGCFGSNESQLAALQAPPKTLQTKRRTFKDLMLLLSTWCGMCLARGSDLGSPSLRPLSGTLPSSANLPDCRELGHLSRSSCLWTLLQSSYVPYSAAVIQHLTPPRGQGWRWVAHQRTTLTPKPGM